MVPAHIYTCHLPSPDGDRTAWQEFSAHTPSAVQACGFPFMLFEVFKDQTFGDLATPKERSCTPLTCPPPKAQPPSSTVMCESRVHFPVENGSAWVCVPSWSAPAALASSWLVVDVKLRPWMYENIGWSLQSFKCEPRGFLRHRLSWNVGFECEGWRTSLLNLPSVPCPLTAEALGTGSCFHFSQNMGLPRTSCHMGFERSDLKVVLNESYKRCSCTIYMIFQTRGWVTFS